ncbi:phospholipid scramblase 1-like [Mya arenaria]|uniref:phospholipid scramblase 1-like n=1 Tax=Mya arenaria TaxID=6604 RepID=UPI0022E7E599|nr:phospholipid scramblase 1-like [Mya arenaria]XP_052774774.1 phospholipid scramblase 1-like [Mya arenaria]
MSVDKQPQGMGMQLTESGLPASVQYLAGVDQLFIKQKIEMLEVLTGFETRNRYAVLNKEMQQVFFVQEESSLCERCFCPMNRGFNLHMTDNNTQEIVRMSRDFKCCMGCCWCGGGCCQMVINVESPVGRLIGRIKTGNSKWKPHIQICDAADNHMFTAWGPCCPCQAVCCPEDIDFPITDPGLTQRVGNVAKVWRGCCPESFTDADQFRVTFPMDMTVECKMLMVAATFLIEFYVFEQQKKNNNSG